MPPAVIEVGTVINDRFEIRHLLGGGGFGVVWLAYDRNLGRDVAIKRLLTKSYRGVDKDEVFSEARKIAQFVHPNIVLVHDVVDFEDEPVIIMEYLAGGSLENYLRGLCREGKWVTINESLRLLKGILKGLHAAHNCETGVIIHKDLKPLNILFGRDGEPKIADFGLASIGVVPKVKTELGKVPHDGTMGYMSPEQLKGMEMDQRSDLFNIGLIAYLLLGSVHPFVDQRFLFNYEEMVTAPYQSLQAISIANVPDEVGRFVSKLLDSDPDQRPQNAQEAMEELDYIENLISELNRQRALEFVEKIRAEEPLPVITEEELADAILIFRRNQQYENAVLVYEKSGVDFSSLNEAAKARLEEDYRVCKTRIV